MDKLSDSKNVFPTKVAASSPVSKSTSAEQNNVLWYERGVIMHQSSCYDVNYFIICYTNMSNRELTHFTSFEMNI